MLNSRGYLEETVQCPVCDTVFVVAPQDPHESDECPTCIEKNEIAARDFDELIDSTLLDEIQQSQIAPFNDD